MASDQATRVTQGFLSSLGIVDPPKGWLVNPEDAERLLALVDALIAGRVETARVLFEARSSLVAIDGWPKERVIGSHLREELKRVIVECDSALGREES